MKKQELEKKIGTAIENATPNKLDSIMNACDTQKKTTIIEMPKQKKGGWKKVLKATSAVAAVLILVLCLSVILNPGTKSSAESVILLDVNPSFSIKIDAEENVVSIKAQNEDAAKILGTTDHKGKHIGQVVNVIVDSMIENDYIGELRNSILVSVEDEDADRGDKLREKVAEMVNQRLQNCKVDGAVLSQAVDCNKKEYKDLAKQHDISVGKAALIQEMISKDATLTFEDLAELSVNELAVISESKQLGTDSVKQTGTPSQKEYITKEAALEAALNRAGLTAEEIKELEIEFDCKKGTMFYEVEFRVGHVEYEYKINATTGEVYKEEIENDDDDGEDIDDDEVIVDTSDFIGEAEAQKIALNDLGLEESAVAFVGTELETDDGVPEYYEVKIYLDTTKHTYKIDLRSGAILAHKEKALGGNNGNGNGNGNGNDNGQQGNQPGSQAGANAIGKEKALKLALTDAGLQESEVLDIELEYDHDDGKAVYEIDFKYNNMEYEYEIDASTGEILKKEADAD